MTYILGIDPGLKGAIAFYCPKRKILVIVDDLPILDIRGKGHLDIYTLTAHIAMVKDSWGIDKAIIEEPGSMPKQGISSTFRFGKTCGQIEGIVAGLGIPMHRVTPATWKRVMGLTADKDHARQKASMTWPKHAVTFARKKDDGRAEAALLALYGAQHVLKIG